MGCHAGNDHLQIIYSVVLCPGQGGASRYRYIGELQVAQDTICALEIAARLQFVRIFMVKHQGIAFCQLRSSKHAFRISLMS